MQSLLSNCDSILLLGEANFSFSLSLKKMLPSSVSMVTTCYQTEDRIPSDDAGIQRNIAHLQALGACVLFGIDATNLHQCSSLRGTSFDAIVFNFPHVGGKGNIGRNRQLLRQFFECGSSRLSPNGQVLLTLCNGQGGTPADKPQRKWNDSWQAVAMATWGSFILTKTVPFRAEDYEDYYCTGYRSQSKRFLTQNAITHVFERSRVILDLLQPHEIPQELTLRITQGSTQEMVTVQCPPDLCRVIDRDLLSEPRHPLALISTDLRRLTDECFPDTTVLKAEELPLLLPADDVITTERLSPSELYHIDLKRACHVPQQDISHHCDQNIGIPQGSILGTTTEKHKQLHLSAEDMQGFPSGSCATKTLQSSVKGKGEMVIDSSHSNKDSMRDEAARQDGTSFLEVGSKQSSSIKTSEQSRRCHGCEDSESSTPPVRERTSENGPECVSSSQMVKSNFVLRPTLLSHVLDILGKEVPLPIYACGRVFRRCGIGPGLYPITHQSLIMVPLPTDFAASWHDFKEKVSGVSAGILNGKEHVSIEECNNCQDGSISNHFSLVLKIKASDDSLQTTVIIGDCGIFHSVKGGCFYCIWNLDRIAMVKYDVEDIRLFWSVDDRIFDKFAKSAEITSESKKLSQNSFKGYSIYPPVYTHDVSFWLNEDTFDELDLCSVIRSVTSDLVREVHFLNQYVNRKISYTYRLVYQSCDGALTKKAATQLQLNVRKAINKWLVVEPR